MAHDRPVSPADWKGSIVAPKKKKRKSFNLPPELRATLERALVDPPPDAETENEAGAPAELLAEFNGHEEALIETLVQIRSVPALNMLYRLARSIDDKSLVKTAKRAIYRLEQTGLEAGPDTKSQAPPLIQAAAKKQPQGYTTSYDPTGARMCILVLPGSYSGYDVALFVADHLRGINDFKAFGATGGEVNRMLKDFGRADPQGLVEIPAGGARLALGEAVERSRSLGVKLPKNYDEFNAKLHLVPRPERPLIYDLINDESLTERIDADLVSAELLSHWLFKGFVLGYELRPYFERIQEVDDGLIILTDAQKQARRQEILVKFQEEFFGPERMAAIVRQIEETALMLWQTGDKRLAEAALVQVLDLNRDPSPNRPYAFILGMIENTLKLMQTLSENRDDEPSPTGSGLILP